MIAEDEVTVNPFNNVNISEVRTKLYNEFKG